MLFDLDELFFPGVPSSLVCFLFKPLAGGSITFDTCAIGFLATGIVSAISTSELELELEEEASEREAGFWNFRAKSGISSSEESSELLPAGELEAEPIFPVSPSPNPDGRNRIFNPLGCWRTGFAAGTVARDVEPLSPGNLTICLRCTTLSTDFEPS